MSRIIALIATSQITETQFEQIDALHYEVENKLLRLIESLEHKKDTGTWISHVSEDQAQYEP